MPMPCAIYMLCAHPCRYADDAGARSTPPRHATIAVAAALMTLFYGDAIMIADAAFVLARFELMRMRAGVCHV